MIAASQAPIHRECIPSLRLVMSSGCASRLKDLLSATEHEDTSSVTPDTMATSAIERARLGSCRLKTEPLSRKTTVRQNVTTEARWVCG